MNAPLTARHHWIFDMDGTLTVAAHDFAAIKHELGLSPDSPILEQLAALDGGRSAALRRRLDVIEAGIARSARAQEGAADLLATLAGRGDRIGILTRNSHHNALATLSQCGFAGYFEAQDVLGREACDPKPSPRGIQLLMDRWRAAASGTAMVGDYLFDLQAGRGAGVATVYFDPTGVFTHAAHADVCVGRLADLRQMIAG